MRKSRTDVIFDIVNTVLTTLIALTMLYPIYFVVIASFSDPYMVAMGSVSFWPRGFSLLAYKNVFANETIWLGYRNTIFYTAAGTMYNLALTIPAAYVLSKRYLPMRTALSWYFFLTMYFSGGLVPTYLQIRDLGLLNTPWVMIVGAGVNCWNLIVTRQFFSLSIPDELYQAARIDGANEFVSFARIALPLAAPIVAVMALFYGVGHWNSYFSAMIYLTKAEQWQPLQMVLRRILILNQTLLTQMETAGSMSGEDLTEAARISHMAESMKYSLIIIASAPLLVAYPFVQKYFVTGMMIGSVKG